MKKPIWMEIRRARRTLRQHSIDNGDLEDVLNRASPDERYQLERGKTKFNPALRLPVDYVYLHSMLNHVSGGKLQNKKLLHIGASTGTYARFLQEKLGVTAIALDIRRSYLSIGKQRGLRNAVNASAIPYAVDGDFRQLESGLWVPARKVIGLPFKDSSLDYIVSDHFLFSDYHPGLDHDHVPGFELGEGSFERSEDALREFNRVLKVGGKILVGTTHAPSLEGFSKYRKGYRVHGFVVEYAFNSAMGRKVEPVGPKHFVLKKVSNIK